MGRPGCLGCATLLSGQLLADLKTWNDAHDFTIAQEDEEVLDDEMLEERGRGTDGEPSRE